MRIRVPGWKVAAAAVAFATLSLGLAGTASAQTLSFEVQTKKDTAVDIKVLEASSVYQVVGIVSAPTNGAAVVVDAKKVRYTPNAGYVGADTFTYMISDGTVSLNGAAHVTVKQQTTTSPVNLSTNVVAACDAFGTADGAMVALCNLYLGNQLPDWAKESIGKVILKRVESFHEASVICGMTTTDAVLTALCGLYLNPVLPESLKKDIGKLVEKYSKQGASTSSVKEKAKDKKKDNPGLSISLDAKAKKAKQHD